MSKLIPVLMLVYALSVIGVAAYLTLHGHDTAGLVSLVTALSPLLLMLAKSSRSDDDDDPTGQSKS